MNLASHRNQPNPLNQSLDQPTFTHTLSVRTRVRVIYCLIHSITASCGTVIDSSLIEDLAEFDQIHLYSNSPMSSIPQENGQYKGREEKRGEERREGRQGRKRKGWYHLMQLRVVEIDLILYFRFFAFHFIRISTVDYDEDDLGGTGGEEDETFAEDYQESVEKERGKHNDWPIDQMRACMFLLQEYSFPRL